MSTQTRLPRLWPSRWARSNSSSHRRRGPGTATGPREDFVHQITPDELRSMLPSWIQDAAEDGSLPGRAGWRVRQAHVVDGRIPHGVLVEVFTDSGVGTMVVDPS